MNAKGKALEKRVKDIQREHSKMVKEKAEKGYVHSGFGDRFVGKHIATKYK